MLLRTFIPSHLVDCVLMAPALSVLADKLALLTEQANHFSR